MLSAAADLAAVSRPEFLRQLHVSDLAAVSRPEFLRQLYTANSPLAGSRSFSPGSRIKIPVFQMSL